MSTSGFLNVDLDVAGAQISERHVGDGEPREGGDVADRLRAVEEPLDVRARRELAAHRHVADGRQVVEVGLEVRDVDLQIVVEADRAKASVDARVRQERADLRELERVGSNGKVGSELRLGESEQTLASAVVGGPVVDAERVRLGREVAVDLERRERSRDGRRVDLAKVPANPRVRVHAEVAHQRREIDPRRVEPGVLEARALAERVDDRVRENERAAREGELRPGALDDVAPDGELAREVVRERVVRSRRTSCASSVPVRSGRMVSPAYRTSRSMPIHPSESGRATARSASPIGARACTWPSIAGRTAAQTGAFGKEDVQVSERQLDPALVALREIARRGGVRGRVEIGRPDAVEAPDEDGVRIDPHPSLDRAQRVVVVRDRAVGPRARPLDRGPADAERGLERRTEGGVVVGRHVEVDGLGGDHDSVEVEVDGAVGDRERVERGVKGSGRLLAALLGLDREVRELSVPDDRPHVGPSRSIWSMASLPASSAKRRGRRATRSHSTTGAPPSLDSTRTRSSSTARGQTRSDGA